MHPVVVIQTQLYLEMAMEVLASIVNLWRGTRTYTYGDSDWRDLLTAYDAIGNPTSYYNGTRWTMSWVNGRSLATNHTVIFLSIRSNGGIRDADSYINPF